MQTSSVCLCMSGFSAPSVELACFRENNFHATKPTVKGVLCTRGEVFHGLRVHQAYLLFSLVLFSCTGMDVILEISGTSSLDRGCLLSEQSRSRRDFPHAPGLVSRTYLYLSIVEGLVVTFVGFPYLDTFVKQKHFRRNFGLRLRSSTVLGVWFNRCSWGERKARYRINSVLPFVLGYCCRRN